jgi:AP-3 complex subunit mu
VKGQLQLPIYVKPQISFNQVGGRVHVMVGALPLKANMTGGKEEMQIEDVVITIPFSKSIGTAVLTSNMGTVQFDDVTKVCKWIIGKLPKTGRNPTLEGNVTLPTGTGAPDSNPILLAAFKITSFVASSLKVDALALHNETYKPYKGVRYITKAGKFQIRS